MPMPQIIRDKDLVILTHSGVNPKHFNPDVLVLAYCIVMQFSNIESTELNVYLKLLGGAGSDSAKIYLEQTAASHKSKTINTMARHKLKNAALQRLLELRKNTDIIRKFRDKLAHWQPYQSSKEKSKIPPPSSDLELFNPPENHKNDAALAGYYKFTKAELNKTLNDANILGRQWMDLEIEIIQKPENLLK